jgi:NADH:ubiquinone oxidoreductase subunit 4 (subunit M)
MLRAVRNILHGELADKWATVQDAASLWRKLPFALLIASLVVLGCFPRLLTDQIKPSVEIVLGIDNALKEPKPVKGKAQNANTGRAASPANK